MSNPGVGNLKDSKGQIAIDSVCPPDMQLNNFSTAPKMFRSLCLLEGLCWNKFESSKKYAYQVPKISDDLFCMSDF